eukprot:s6995_g2.t1
MATLRSTTSLSVGCPSLPGCAGARQMPPSSVGACGAECQTADTHEWHAATCYKEHRRGTRDCAAERAGQFCHPEKDDDHNALTSTPEARTTGAAKNECCCIQGYRRAPSAQRIARGEAPAARAVPAAPPPEPRPHHISLTGAPGDQGPDDALLDDAPPHADDHTAGATSQGGSSALAGISASAWSSFDAVDLTAEFGTPVSTMQSVPVFLRSGLRQAFVLALRALREAYMRGTAPQQTRAWKLFLLAPRFLLHRAREPGTVGREAPLQHS